MHQISVVALSFLTTGPILEGVLQVTLPLQYTSGEAAPFHPIIKEEEEEEKEEEEIVDVSNSEDDHEVFNQPLSPEIPIGDLDQPLPTQVSHHQEVTNILDTMGIQCKPMSTLQELLKSQPKGNMPGKATQTRLPTPPPIQPLRSDPANHKRKREQKGKEAVEVGKTHPSQEVEPQRGAKQARGMQTRSFGEGKRKGG